MKYKLIPFFILLTLIFNACNSKPKDDGYVSFEKFKEGRVCAEVKFMCLPESQNKSWQKEPLLDGADTFELTPERIKRYDYIVKAWQYNKKERKEKGMLVTDLDKDLHKKVEAKQFLIEMEKSLEKEFPGFWKDIPKPVRYRWIRRAMNKAEKFGYDPHLNNMIVELCARIGLDFDVNLKWKSITEFIKIKERYIGDAIAYLDFTLFNKNEDWVGNLINDWSLRDALHYLPYPKRPLPRLHDLEKEAEANGL